MFTLKIISGDATHENTNFWCSLVKSNLYFIETNKYPQNCLLYWTVTPADYEPPGFKKADSDNFVFEDEPMTIKVGDVSTVSII
jgi:hypothetical protein